MNPQFVLLLMTGGVLTIYLNALDQGGDLYQKTLAFFIVIAAAIFPSYLYFSRQNKVRGRDGVIPFVQLVGVIYGLYYGLPLLISDTLWFRFNVIHQDFAIAALELSLLGWLMLLLGFYMSPFGRGIQPLKLELAGSRIKNLAAWLVCVGMVSSIVRGYIQIPAALLQPFLVLVLLTQIGAGLLIVLSLRGQLSGFWNAGLWLGLIPGMLLLAPSSGLTSSMIYLVVFFLMLYWGVRKKVPWIAIGFLVIIAILVRPAMDEYRQLTWGGGSYSGASKIEKTVLLWELVIDRVSVDDKTKVVDGDLEFMQSRTSQLSTFAHVIDKTPSQVPYWMGETYLSVFTSLIPRFIWQDKPVKDLGQRFGHRYGFLDAHDTSTSMNFPQLVEAYANFGIVGVIVCMWLIGVVYRIIYCWLNTSWGSNGVIVIGAFVFSNLINIESDFSLVFGAIFQAVLVLYLILRLGENRNQKKRVSPVTTKR